MSKGAVLNLSVPFLALALIGCEAGPASLPAPTLAPTAPTTAAGSPVQPGKGEQTMAFQLTSTAFGAGQPIPARYTCTGQDISPPLSWTDPPQGTRSLALILDDPDAPSGTFVHWVIFNLPPTSRALYESISPKQTELPDGSRQGSSSSKRTGYGGPCPPSGTHRYFFRLYALDTMLDLPAGATKDQVLKAAQGHIVAQAELMGTYAKTHD
jgi:Raf kinase inhibitor-like YbhB/YbcL family protein